ncbi:MAG: hypothetical protein AAF333_08295 [Planctomycetota bacterium]
MKRIATAWCHVKCRSVLLMVAVCAGLVGCTSKLRVETEPAGAIVTVSDERGRMLRTGPSPLLAELNIAEGTPTSYRVDVVPTTEQAERFYGDAFELTTAGYLELPVGEDKARVLSFELVEKDYVNLPLVEVVLTPEGKWVGVATKSRSYKDIGEAGGNVPTRIVDFGDNRGIQGLALSPDGQRIVYSEAVYERRLDSAGTPGAPGLGGVPGAPGAEGQVRVYQLKGANLRGINIEGGGVQYITTDDFQDMFPSFTPPESRHGELILFSSNRRGDLLSILGIRSAGRSGISNIYVDNSNTILLKPTAGRNDTIAFAGVNVDPVRGAVTQSEIWTNFGPNEFPTLIDTDGGGRDPAISPEGDQIAYISTRRNNLWVISTDVGPHVELTTGAADIMRDYRKKLTGSEAAYLDVPAAPGYGVASPFRSPSWTPDGKYILYTSMEGVDPEGRPNEDIWIISADGTEKYQLTTNGSADRFPVVSPDGQHIYFLSNRGESWGVWRILFEGLE